MSESDSIPRLIKQFFSSITESSFVYEGKMYNPTTLIVSPGLLRSYTCPENCGACCRSFSMDFLPNEPKPQGIELVEKTVNFNNKKYPLFAIKRFNKNSVRCEQLDQSTGRCTVHDYHSFFCDFELIRFTVPKKNNLNKPSYLNNRLRGRYWNMIKVDGTKGALCKMLPPTEESIKDVTRRILRLQDWCDYFELKSKIPRILKWIQFEDISKPLIIKPTEEIK